MDEHTSIGDFFRNIFKVNTTTNDPQPNPEPQPVQQPNPEPQPVQQYNPEPQPVQQPNTEPHPALQPKPNISTAENNDLLEQIQKLQQTNQALLNNITIKQEPPTIERQILELCVPKERREKVYGIN